MPWKERSFRFQRGIISILVETVTGMGEIIIGIVQSIIGEIINIELNQVEIIIDRHKLS